MASVASTRTNATACGNILDSLLRSVGSEAVRREFLATGQAANLVDRHKLQLLVGTYNVNGRSPPPGIDLSPWLAGAEQADVVIVGFQEIVPLTANHILNDLMVGASSNHAAAWDLVVGNTLNGVDTAATGQGSQHSSHHDDSSREGSVSEANHKATATPATPQRIAQLAGGERQPQSQLHSGATVNEDRKEQDIQRTALATADKASLQAACTAEDGSALSDTSQSLPASGTNFTTFLQVVAKQLVGVHLSIWVRSTHLGNVHGIQVTAVRTGAMGLLGNKGAVVARLKVFDTALAIVVAHMSSGEAPGDDLRRNFDYSEVMRRVAFPPESSNTASETASPARAEALNQVKNERRSPGCWGNAKGILDSDFALWLGDLNYRLTEVSDTLARELLREGKLRHLAAHDELTIMRHTGRAFQGWEEGPLSFMPTYKMQRGTSQYQGSKIELQASSTTTAPEISATVQKTRTPAWTDRILWWCPEGGGGEHRLRLQSYQCARLTASDHLPVVAQFELPVQHYDRDRVEAAIAAASRRVDAAEMAATPHCELVSSSVDVGTLCLGQCGQGRVILRNTGQIEAAFALQQLPGALLGDTTDQTPRTAPRWTSVHPQHGSLKPGESIDINISVTVTAGVNGTVEAIVAGNRCKLDAVLVLRISGGNDLFIVISGSYQPSFLGLSLATLATLPRPLAQQHRSASSTATAGSQDESAKPISQSSIVFKGPVAHLDQDQDIANSATNFLESPGSLALVPPEIRALTEFLRRPAVLQSPSVFNNLADHVTAPFVTDSSKIIREAVESSQPIPPHVAPIELLILLLVFLASLPSSLISTSAAGFCETMEIAQASLLAEHLSATDRALFSHVLAFFREALSYSNPNGLSLPFVASSLADALFGMTSKPDDNADDSLRETQHQESSSQTNSTSKTAHRIALINALLWP